MEFKETEVRNIFIYICGKHVIWRDWTGFYGRFIYDFMRKVEWDYPIPSYFLFAMVMIMEYTPKIVVVIGKMMTVFRLWWLNIVMENCTFIYDLPIPDFRWYILSPWWWPLYGGKDIDSVKTRTWLGRNKSDDDVPSFVHLSWPMTFCNLL